MPFDGGDGRAAWHAAERQATQAREQARATRLELSAQLASLWSERGARAERLRAQERVVQSSAAVRDAYWQQFTIGRRSIVDLLNAEQESFLARFAAEDERLGLVQQEHRMLAAVGLLTDWLGIERCRSANREPRAVARRARLSSPGHSTWLTALRLLLRQHGVSRSEASLGPPACPASRCRGSRCCCGRPRPPGARRSAGPSISARSASRCCLSCWTWARTAPACCCRARAPGPRCLVVGSDETVREADAAEAAEHYTGRCLLWRCREATSPSRGLHRRHWLWSVLWRYRGYYADTALAAALVNVLTLAGTFFVMNVYDRVIVNQAYVTLWTLATGVTLAIGFECLARCLRRWLIDTAGRKADLVVGARLFEHALAIRLEQRPASAGAMASQLREFESVRDFASSLTLVTLTDLPFLLLFIAVTA